MTFAGILFDVDGVLVDSPHERAWRETLDELMRGPWSTIRPKTQYAPERFDTNLYLDLVAGKPREDGARAVLEHFHVPDAARRAVTYAERKQDALVALLQAGAFAAYPDALRFVRATQCLGLRLAAASSSKNAELLLSEIVLDESGAGEGSAPFSPDSIDERGAESPVFAPTPTSGRGQPLLDAFHASVCGKDIPRGKPHPDIFLLAAKELGVVPSASVVVEDAASGILAAKSAGMTALGVARHGDEAKLAAAGADLVVRSLDEVDLEALARGALATVRRAA